MTARLVRRPPRPASPFVALLLGLLATLAGLVPPVVPPAAAAGPTLTIVTQSRYDVRPDQRLVHVTVDARASASAVNDPIHTYWFTAAPLEAPPSTANFAATVGGTAVPVTVTRRTADYVLLAVSFGQNLNAGSSLAFRLQFDLVDPGGAPDRATRISPSLVSFQAWPIIAGDTAGSSVTVVFPAGYDATQEAGGMPAPTIDASGATTFSSGPLDHPTSFFSDLTAERPGAFTDTVLHIGTLDLTVRAWQDDPAWGAQVADLLTKGLPALTRLIGLGPPRFDSLVVEESVSRAIGGYSGLFDPATGRIQVAYYAAPFVILHEAAHAWFNSRLATDRWIDEAFASYYAEQAAAALGLKVAPQQPSPDLEKSRVALNDWGAVGRESQAVEEYAYAATLRLAELVGSRTTLDRLATVWAAIAAGQAAYQPVHGGSPETTTQGPPDWRGLLDQLEERTGASYADLWRTWVVSADQLPLLDARAAARADYQRTVQAAGAWELPRPIRDALGTWQFPAAERLMTAARDVLGQRDVIARRAAADGLTPPTTLRAVFEHATGGLDSAAAEARDEAAALDAIEAADGASRPDHGMLGQVGLLGSSPAVELAAARTAFSAGDLASAKDRAVLARSEWDGAESTGRDRLVLAGLLLVVLLVAALLWRFRRRRRRPAGAGPYATLGGGPQAGAGAMVAGAPRPDGGEDGP
ncbi:MAG TPA: hypothetical protein VF763_03675 [Candidatus Limnocylindrales bacterium]